MGVDRDFRRLGVRIARGRRSPGAPAPRFTPFCPFRVTSGGRQRGGIWPGGVLWVARRPTALHAARTLQERGTSWLHVADISGARGTGRYTERDGWGQWCRALGPARVRTSICRTGWCSSAMTGPTPQYGGGDETVSPADSRPPLAVRTRRRREPGTRRAGVVTSSDRGGQLGQRGRGGAICSSPDWGLRVGVGAASMPDRRRRVYG